MALLPHVVWWLRVGEPVYFADHDDLLYLSVTGQAYFNHPLTLGDPTQVSGGATTYPGLQFVPGIVLARILRLGPSAIDVFWRAWAGVSIGLGSYVVIRQFVRGPALAAALAIFFMADVGVFSANPLWKQGVVAFQAATGRAPGLFDTFPQLLVQWRIITPALSFGYLLLHIWLLARARERPTWPRLFASGIGFGLLFHSYFYYWTSAGLALVLALALDAGHRRVYFHTGWIGGLIGLPAIVSGYLVKRAYSPDWLHRTDNFLPIARFSEILVPKAGLILLAIGLAAAWLRRRDLLYLACLAGSGLALTNHQVATGLQIQNFHWVYVWAPCVSLLVILLLAHVLMRSPWPRPVVWAAIAVWGVHVSAGLWLRAQEATRSAQSLELMNVYTRYRAQRLRADVPSLPANLTVAGDPDFVEFAVGLENLRPLDHYCVAFSPGVRDAEYGERMALNAVLRGVDRSAFLAGQAKELTTGWGPWSRDPRLRAARLDFLSAAYDACAADPTALIDRFGVRIVARANATPPPGSDWQPIQSGPSWHLWERNRPQGR